MNFHVPLKKPWSADELRLVTQRWSEGYSAAQISNEMQGRTRNAVIGAVSRLNLPHRQTKHSAFRKSRVRKSDAEPRTKRGAGELREARRLAKSRVWLPLPETIPVTLVERAKHQCAWPVGEGLFCGEVKVPARSYCGVHCSIAYLPAQKVA